MYYRQSDDAIPEPRTGSPTMAAMPETPAPYGTPTDPRPLEAALDRVGDRWSLLIVESLLDRPRRFGELNEALPGIAPPGTRGDRARNALPAAARAHGLRADGRGARSRERPAASRRLGRPPHR